MVPSVRLEEGSALANAFLATESLRDATDDQLLARARSEKRILVTEDKDLGELVHPVRRARHMGSDRESCPAIVSQVTGSAHLTGFRQFL